MNWDMLFSRLLTSGPARFPDEKLADAAKLLAEDDRPARTQMVSLDNVPEYKFTKTPDQMREAKRKVGAFARSTERDDPAQTVYVNRDGDPYNAPDARILAGTLAHEKVHTRRKDDDEVEPYQQQYDAMLRLGVAESDPKLMRNLLDRIALLKQMKRGKQ